MQPTGAILITKRAGLAAPQAAVEIIVELRVADRVHAELRDGEPHVRLGTRNIDAWLPDAHAAVDAVNAAAQELEHPASVGLVVRLAEYLAVAFGHRIAREDNAS